MLKIKVQNKSSRGRKLLLLSFSKYGCKKEKKKLAPRCVPPPFENVSSWQLGTDFSVSVWGGTNFVSEFLYIVGILWDCDSF